MGEIDLKIAAHTDTGIRKNINQDSVLVKTAQTDYGKTVLASICDGMGGLAKGELASAAAVRMLSRWFEETFPEILYQGVSLERLKRSWNSLISSINEKIAACGRARNIQMGTTMVMLLIVDRVYYTGNVGDSRVYLLKDGIIQLTKDQTLVQREIDAGRIAGREADRDPRRNVLLQCVGASRSVVPDYGTGSVKSKTMFLLCSDGFRHMVDQKELYEALNPYRLQSEQKMQESLICLTDLNKRRRETDNISSVLIRVEERRRGCFRQVRL